MIDRDILQILCCPACKGDLEESEGYLVCRVCGLKYPIEDGIPILLVEEAKRDDRD